MNMLIYRLGDLLGLFKQLVLISNGYHLLLRALLTIENSTLEAEELEKFYMSVWAQLL